MIVGKRLKILREEKNLSQGDVEQKTGLLRCYISRVENGHTVPNVETLEKFAGALEVPLYRLFYDGEPPPKLPKLAKAKGSAESAWGREGKEAMLFAQFRALLSRTSTSDQKLLLSMAEKMAKFRPAAHALKAERRSETP